MDTKTLSHAPTDRVLGDLQPEPDDLRCGRHGGLLNAEQARQYVGYPGSPQRWYAIARAGLVPSIRVGRRRLFVPRQLDEWLATGGSIERCG